MASVMLSEQRILVLVRSTVILLRCAWDGSISREDAEGAAGVGMAKALSTWVPGRCKLETWCINRMRCEIIDAVRSARRAWPVVVCSEHDEPAAAGAPEIDRLACRAAFAGLGDRSRDIVDRVIMRGETYAEAGQAMAMTARQVRHQCDLALQTMRESVQGG